MGTENQEIPTRKNSEGKMEVETRPVYVEEWLDSLPYIDFDKTTGLLNQAMRETNHIKMKPSQRFELVGEYNRPYQYYIDSQIKVGARHTLHSIETLQSQVHSLKQLSVAMAMACRITIEESLNKKTLWMQSKPPLAEILMAMNYFSHTLIFSYLEYAPVPKNVWREISFLYDFAESINQENTLVHDHMDEKQKKVSSIAAAYKRIILASMVDPHHLPFGAIWEVYAQLESWVDKVSIKPYQQLQDGTGYFVIDVKHDVRPVPYNKFNQKLAANRKLCLLDATELVKDVQTYLQLLKLNRALDDSIIFSNYYARTILEQMVLGWGAPAKRKHARNAKSGNLEIAIGIHASHYYLSSENHFIARISVDEDNEFDQEDITTTIYLLENWELVDSGPGGYALTRNSGQKNQTSANHARVGDLVAIKKSASQYQLGVIRWLMIRPKQLYKAGIELISDEAQAVAIRKQNETVNRRAFLHGDINNGSAFVITEQGFYEDDAALVLTTQRQEQQINASALLESTTLLEQFRVEQS